jgi:hypothetical protein
MNARLALCLSDRVAATRVRFATALAALVLGAAPSTAQVVVLADAGDDVEVECAMAGANVTVDGTASSVDGLPAAGNAAVSFAWSADGVIFDDPSSPTPLGSFPLGTTVVTLTVTHTDPTTTVQTASDDTVEVTVGDDSPPTFSVYATPEMLWPPDHSLREIEVDIEVEDGCDAEVDVVLHDIESNEPDNGIGDGNTSDDIQEAELDVDDRHFLLRAERQGPGSGRVYTATYRAFDATGNYTDAVALVTVPHDQGGGSVELAPTPLVAPAPPLDAKAAKRAQKAAARAAKAARRAQKAAAKAAKEAAKAAARAARQHRG